MILKYLLLPKVTKIKGHCAGISMALFRTLLSVPNKVTGRRPRWRERWFVIYYGSDHTDFTPVPVIVQSGVLGDLRGQPCWHEPKPGRAQLLLLCFSKSSVYFLLFALLYWTGPTFNEIVLRPHSNFIVLGLMLQKDTFYWALFQQLNKPLRPLCLNTDKVIAICLLYFVFPSNPINLEIAIIPAQVQAEIVPANLLSYCGYLVAPACLPHFTGQGGLN